MNLKDYIKGPAYRRQAQRLEEELSELRARHSELESIAKNCGAMEIFQIKNVVEKEKEALKSIRSQLGSAERELLSFRQQKDKIQNEILAFEETILLESFALYEPKFKLNASHEYKTRLDSVRELQKAMIKSGAAATGNMDWQVNGSKVEGRKLVSDMIKLVLRSFNNESDYCVDNVKFDNIELGEKRIRKSFEACNRLGRIMSVQLSERYLNLKIDELRLAHEYQLKKQEEKEEAKRIREELREQHKLEQEIRLAREKIAKERKHFSTALRDLNLRLGKTTDEEEINLLLAKIAQLEAGREALDNEEKIIDYREKNAKAGYVYVISNIGTFGEGVYKIGMTRRLDPMERIDELGDASVPFWFDIHAMIFSDNAPALEAKLHEKFASGRLNKVNGRKEFFRAEISEIERVIRENYDNVAEIIHEAPAEQYRESLRMAMPKT